MKVTKLYSATVLIEDNGVKLLCDPWLVDGEYLGSWFCYPSQKNFDFSTLDDVDYIYISHIHPDHLSVNTLKKLNKNIPIIIRDFEAGKFVKLTVERLGFKTIELKDNKRFNLKNNLHLTIMGAGFCNPEACTKQFGCSVAGFISETHNNEKNNFVASQIDTLCIIDNNDKVVLNINDCPYNIAKYALNKVLKRWPNIDLLLHGYAGASAYPHCFENYTENEITNVYGPKQNQYYLEMGLHFINHIKPKNHLPFAGTLVLGGKLANEIEPIRVYNEIDEAYNYYKKFVKESKTILLNDGEYYNLNTNKTSKNYTPTNLKHKKEYIKEISNYSYKWENNPIPTLEELKDLSIKGFNRFKSKMQEYNFKSNKFIYLPLVNNVVMEISCSTNEYEFVNLSELKKDNFIVFKVDPRLLKELLLGPRYAHWNNAEIGCHIKFNRKTDIYERGIHFCMNYFHI